MFNWSPQAGTKPNWVQTEAAEAAVSCRVGNPNHQWSMSKTTEGADFFVEDNSAKPPFDHFPQMPQVHPLETTEQQNRGPFIPADSMPASDLC